MSNQPELNHAPSVKKHNSVKQENQIILLSMQENFIFIGNFGKNLI